MRLAPAPSGALSQHAPPPRRLIVNADDFGASRGVNAGIVEAHDSGIVTSTSLMVTMPAAREAAALAALRPGLSVGIHVDLTGEGRPGPVDTADVEACRAEIRSQIDRFEELTGTLPSHVDGHHNIFRMPRLTPLFVDAAGAIGRPLREHSWVRYHSRFYGQWDDGLTHAEWIGPENLIRMLDEEIGAGVTELSCHPGRVDPALDTSYHLEREIELQTLCDPRVRRHIEASDLVLLNYDDLLALDLSDGDA